MSNRLYGSLNNRLEENRMFCKKVEVGTPATVYHYSDRTPYEVVDVIDEKHFVIRKLDAKRTDNNGMSDAQDYEYSSNPNNTKEHIKFRRGSWVYVSLINKADENEISDESSLFMLKWHRNAVMTEKQREKYEKGKDVEISHGKLNISFGKAEKYYDYSF